MVIETKRGGNSLSARSKASFLSLRTCHLVWGLMMVERKRGVGSPPIFCLDLPKRPGRQSERAGYEPVYYWPTSCNPNFDKTCAKFNFLKRDIFDISRASIFENNTLKNLPPRKEITMVYNKWVEKERVSNGRQVIWVLYYCTFGKFSVTNNKNIDPHSNQHSVYLVYSQLQLPDKNNQSWTEVWEQVEAGDP